MHRSLAITLNALGLCAIALVLLVAFAAQLVLHELPCPLCLLQRFQLGADSYRPLRAAPEPLCCIAVDRGRRRGFRRAADSAARRTGRSRLWLGAARVSLLHLGLHRFCRGHHCAHGHAAVRQPVRKRRQPQPAGVFARTAAWLVLALTALNVISTLLECGFAACPDNPLAYELLKRAP